MSDFDVVLRWLESGLAGNHKPKLVEQVAEKAYKLKEFLGLPVSLERMPPEETVAFCLGKYIDSMGWYSRESVYFPVALAWAVVSQQYDLLRDDDLEDLAAYILYRQPSLAI